jgi:uncharacterized protein YndB with AHSA1/START domain
MVEDVAHRVDFPSDREIHSIRRIRAPRELVFRAFTEAEHLVRWWGPRGFSMTVDELDIRPNGNWNFTFHGPDGTNYRNQLTFLAIERPSRIVLRHHSPPPFTITATLEEKDGVTLLTFGALFDSAAACEAVKPIAVPGNQQTLDRLEERLAAVAAGKEFVVTRLFDAPRDLVWRAWTEVFHLKRWLGPKGFAIKGAKLDLVPGGSFHYGMVGPDGGEMWGKWIFREIVPPQRLVLVNFFSDAEGGVIRHPMSPTWPRTMLSTTEFAEEGAQTRMTLRCCPIDAEPAEINTFLGAFASMEQGWRGTLAQLEEYLRASQGGRHDG